MDPLTPPNFPVFHGFPSIDDSADPFFPWRDIDFSYDISDEPVLNDVNEVEPEDTGQVSQVVESYPTSTLPQWFEPQFCPASHVINQVSDSGSGGFSLLAPPEVRQWEVLSNLGRSEMKPYHILTRLWIPAVVTGLEVLRCSEKHVFGPSTNVNPFMIDIFGSYMVDSLTKVFSISGETRRSKRLHDDLAPHYSTVENATYLLNKWLPVTAYRQRRTHCAPNLHIFMSGDGQGKNNITCTTVALPVFDCSTNTCVGIIELLINSLEVHYATEAVDMIRKLLEGVSLHTDTLAIQPRHIVLVEIYKVLKVVCETHNLPSAQTWLRCECGENSSDTEKICMSNAVIPFYIMDSTLFDFWQASSDYHICKGQGVAGRAFMSEASCFCKDITQFPENEFPLVRTSRKFQMYGSLAICLKSSYTGSNLYIIQFFLTRNLTTIKDQRVVDSIIMTMTQCFQSLKLVSSEFEEIDAKSGNIISQKKLIPHLDDGLDFVYSSNANMEQKLSNARVVPLEDTSTIQLKDNERVVVKGAFRKKTVQILCKEDLVPYLRGTIKDAAKALKISPSTLKRICRRLGLRDWKEAQCCVGIPPVRRKRPRQQELCEGDGSSCHS